MTRRRKITLISLITAGVVLVAGTAAATTTLVLRHDPAEPVAFEPAPTTQAPQPSPTSAETAASDLAGLGACHDLFRDDMLIHVDLMTRQVDDDTATEWVDEVHRIARSAEHADAPEVSRAAERVGQTILDASGSPLGDVIDLLLDGDTAPVNQLMLACVGAGLVEPEDVQRFADSALGG